MIETKKNIFLIMELVPNGTLAAFIKERQ